MIHYLSHILGLDSANGGYYLFWSGFGSDLAEITVALTLVKGFIALRAQRLLHHNQLISTLSKATDE